MAACLWACLFDSGNGGDRGPGRLDHRAPMPTPRQEMAAALFRDRIYVAGGLLQSHLPTAAVEAYDPRTAPGRQAAPLPQPLHHQGLAAVGDRLYCVGGYATGFLGTDVAYAYDADADAWESPRTPARPRRSPCHRGVRGQDLRLRRDWTGRAG